MRDTSKIGSTNILDQIAELDKTNSDIPIVNGNGKGKNLPDPPDPPVKKFSSGNTTFDLNDKPSYKRSNFDTLEEPKPGRMDDFRSTFGGGTFHLNESAENYRAFKQSNWKQAGNAALRLIPNTALEILNQTGALFDIEDYAQVDNEVGNWLSTWANKQKDAINELTPIHLENPGEFLDVGDFAWWMDRGTSLVQSVAAFAIVGRLTGMGLTGALGRGASVASNLTRSARGAGVRSWLSTLGNPAVLSQGTKNTIGALGALGNSYLLTHAEGIGVATDTFEQAYATKYKELIDQGLSVTEADTLAKEDAARRASSAYNFNKLNVLLNLTSAGAFIGSPRITRDVIRQVSMANTLKRMGYESIQEGFEEQVNLLAERQALDDDYSLNKAFKDATSLEGIESFLLGAVGGAGQTMATSGTRAIPLKRDADGNRVSQNTIQMRDYAKQQANIAYNEEIFGSKDITKLTDAYSGAAKMIENVSRAAKLTEQLGDPELPAADRVKLQAELDQVTKTALFQQAEANFKQGTTESFLEMFDSISKLTPEQAAAKGLPETYVEDSKKAIDTIEVMEREYILASRFLNQKQVYDNRVYDRILQDGLADVEERLEPLEKQWLQMLKNKNVTQNYTITPIEGEDGRLGAKLEFPKEDFQENDEGVIENLAPSEKKKQEIYAEANPEFMALKVQHDYLQKQYDANNEAHRAITSPESQTLYRKVYEASKKAIEKEEAEKAKKKKKEEAIAKAAAAAAKKKGDTTPNPTDPSNPPPTGGKDPNAKEPPVPKDPPIEPKPEKVVPTDGKPVRFKGKTDKATKAFNDVFDAQDLEGKRNLIEVAMGAQSFKADPDNYEKFIKQYQDLYKGTREDAIDFYERMALQGPAILASLEQEEASAEATSEEVKIATERAEAAILNLVEDLESDLTPDPSDNVDDMPATQGEANDFDKAQTRISKLISLLKDLETMGVDTNNFAEVARVFNDKIGHERLYPIFDSLQRIFNAAKLDQPANTDSFSDIFMDDEAIQLFVQTMEESMAASVPEGVYTASDERYVFGSIQDLINTLFADNNINPGTQYRAGETERRSESGHNILAYLAKDYVTSIDDSTGEAVITKRDADNLVNDIAIEVLDPSIIKPGTKIAFTVLDSVTLRDGSVVDRDGNTTHPDGTVTEGNPIDNAPIGVMLDGKLLKGVYMHTPSWSTKLTIYGDVAEDVKKMREIRQYILNQNAPVQTTVIAKSNGSLVFDKQYRKASEALPADTKLAIGKDGKFMTELKESSNVINKEAAKSGIVYAIIELGNNKSIAMPMSRNRLNADQINSILSVIDVYFEGLEDSDLARDFKNRGINILDFNAVKDYIGTFVKVHTEFGTGLKELLAQKNEGVNIFNMIRIKVGDQMLDKFEYGSGQGINHAYYTKQDYQKDKETNRDNAIKKKAAFMQGLKEHLQGSYHQIDLTKFGTEVSFPIVKEEDGTLEDVTMSYNDYAKEVTRTKLSSVSLPNGKTVHTVQHVMKFDTSFLKVKPTETEETQETEAQTPKAAIESKRQEELKGYNAMSTETFYLYDLTLPLSNQESFLQQGVKQLGNTALEKLSRKEYNEAQRLIKLWVESGLTIKEIGNKLDERFNVRGISGDIKVLMAESAFNKINAKYDAEYVEAVKKGEMTKEQALQALEEAGRKDSSAYAEIASLETQPTETQSTEAKEVELERRKELMNPLNFTLLTEENIDLYINDELAYRSLGQEGYIDAIESGTLRQKGAKEGDAKYSSVYFGNGLKGFNVVIDFASKTTGNSFIAVVPRQNLKDAGLKGNASTTNSNTKNPVSTKNVSYIIADNKTENLYIATQEDIDKINAKYNAELKAPETTETTKPTKPKVITKGNLSIKINPNEDFDDMPFSFDDNVVDDAPLDFDQTVFDEVKSNIPDTLIIKDINFAFQELLVNNIISSALSELINNPETIDLQSHLDDMEVLLQQTRDYYIEIAPNPKGVAFITNVLDNYDKVKAFVNHKLQAEEFIKVRTEQLDDYNESNPENRPDETDEGEVYLENIFWLDDASFVTDPKKTASKKVKMALSGIPMAELNYEQITLPNGDVINQPVVVTGMLGLKEVFTYQNVYEDLMALLARSNEQYVPSNFDAMMQILEDNIEFKPYLHYVINDTYNENGKVVRKGLKSLDERFKNSFVKAMSKTYTSHKVLLKKDNVNEWYMANSDSTSVMKRLVHDWKQDLKLSPYMQLEVSTGAMSVYDKKGITKAFEELKDKVMHETDTIEDVNGFLNIFGINIEPALLDELKSKGMYSKNADTTSKMLPYKSLYLSPSGVFNILHNNFKDSDTNFDNAHPLDDTAVTALAFLNSKHIVKAFSNSGKNVEGKSYYWYNQSKFFTDQAIQLKNDTALLDRLFADPFSKHSIYLKSMTKVVDGKRVFDTTSPAYQAFKYGTIDGNKLGKYDSKTIDQNDVVEHELFKLQAFLNQGVKVKMKGGEARRGNIMFSTISDKSTLYMIETILYNINSNKGEIFASPALLDSFFNTFALPEISRMIHHSLNPDINIKGRKEAANIFYIIPELNHVPEIWLDGDRENGIDPEILNKPEVKIKIANIIKRHLESLTADKMAEWRDFGFIKLGEETVNGVKQKVENLGIVDNRYAKEYGNRAENIAFNFVYNTLMAEVNFRQLFSTDIANYYKSGKDFTIEQTIAATFDNLGKRLAAENAPGDEHNMEDNEKVNYAFVNDLDMPSDYLNEITSKIDNLTPEDKRAYSKIQVTDAQEFTSLDEHLKGLVLDGTITEKEAKRIKRLDNRYELRGKDLELILQTTKPVYVNNIERDGVLTRLYIKSSAFPLTKTLTQGLQIDKLRDAMDKSKIDRVAFNSAIKVGQVNNPVTIFNTDGTIKDNIDFTNHVQEVPRKGFKIQQPVPYSETKTTVNDGTQQRKLLFTNILDVDFNGVKGSALFEAYNNTYHKMFKMKYDNFIKNYTNEDGTIIIEKFHKRIMEEAVSRDYPLKDINFLNLAIRENGKVEFENALWASPIAGKIESLLNSIIDNDIRKLKVPGRSFVLTTEAGFGFDGIIEENDITKLENHTNIIADKQWLKESGGKLRPMRTIKGKVLPAEVMIKAKIKLQDGTMLSYKDITDDDGFINSNLSEEALMLFGFRIPTQSHKSMALIKIVGFLPENFGDQIVAPKEFVAQMGSDFDVDKLYTNMYNLFRQKDGKIVRYKSKDESIKNYENDLLDIHFKVLSNPKIQSQIHKPLSFGNLKTLSEQFKKRQAENSNITFSGMSDTYQRNKYLQARAGKQGVSVFSLDSVTNALMQGKGIYLYDTVLDDEGNPEQVKTEIRFGEVTSNELSDIYASDGRYKSDIIEAFQSAAVDNENEQILGALNINKDTFDVIRVLAMSGFTEDTIIAFINQPAILHYIYLKNKSENSISNYNANNIEKDMKEKYNTSVSNEAIETAYSSPSEAEMMKMIEEPMEGDNRYNAYQLGLYNKFVKLTEKGKTIQAMQSSINSDSKGVGKDLFYTNEKIEQIRNLDSLQGIENAGAMLGDYAHINPKTSSEMAVQQRQALVDAGYIKIGHDSYLRPETINGFASVYGTMTAGRIMNQLFPYSHPSLVSVFSDVKELIGIDSKSINRNANENRKIWNEIKSYINARYINNFTDGDIVAERLRLNNFSKDNISFARILSEVKKGRLATNPLVSRISYEFDPLGVDKVKYDAASGEGLDEDLIFQGFLALFNDTKPIGTYNGIEYTGRLFAQDLITQSYINGGIQGIDNLVKYIPLSYLSSIGYSNNINNTDFGSLFTLDSNETKNVVRQYIQHHPAKVAQDTINGITYNDNKSEFNVNDIEKFTESLDYTKGGAKGFPFISFYQKAAGETAGRFRLYEKVGDLKYVEIDLLGDKGIKEYSPNRNTGVTTMYKNKAKVGPTPVPKTADPIENKTKPETEDSGVVKEGRTVREIYSPIIYSNKTNKEKVADLLTEALKTSKNSFHNYVMNKILENIDNLPDFNIAEETGRKNGSVHSNKNTGEILLLTLNLSIAPNKFSATLVHELVHTFTIQALLENKTGSAIKLHGYYKTAKKYIESLFEPEELMYIQDKINRRELVTPREKLLYYVSNEREFTAGIMENKLFQETLKDLKVEGKQSFLDQVLEFFSDLVANLGLNTKKDSLLVKSITEVLNLLEEGTTTSTEIANNSELTIPVNKTMEAVKAHFGIVKDGVFRSLPNAQEIADFINKNIPNLKATVFENNYIEVGNRVTLTPKETGEETNTEVVIPQQGDQLSLFGKKEPLKDNSAPIKAMNDITNHSGGAKGYDAEWDIIGSEYGMINNKHYLLPEDGEVSDPRLRGKGVKPVDATNDIGHVAKTGPATGEAQLAVSQAERLMGRIGSTHFTRNTKKIRNYAQVKNADAIFAVGSLIPKGSEITIARGQATKTALVPQVNGGTSVAVQLSIMQGKPTYVFNQVANNSYSEGWYKWDTAKKDFIPTETPVLTKNFAGIGTSSNTTEAGKQAIRDVYQKTKDNLEKAETTEIGVPSDYREAPKGLFNDEGEFVSPVEEREESTPETPETPSDTSSIDTGINNPYTDRYLEGNEIFDKETGALILDFESNDEALTYFLDNYVNKTSLFETKVDQFSFTYNPNTGEVIHNSKKGDTVVTNETQINKVLVNYALENGFETREFNKHTYVKVDGKVLNTFNKNQVTNPDIVKLFDTPIPTKAEPVVEKPTGFSFTYDGVTIPTEYQLGAQQIEALEKAIHYIKTDNNFDFYTIEGSAGTGKTTITGYLERYFKEASGMTEFRYMALTHAATSVLALSTSAIGNLSLPSTIASSFYDYVDGDGIRKRGFHKKLGVDGFAKYVLVVDEISMVEDSELESFLEIAKQQNIKVVFLGDNKQIPSPSANSLDVEGNKYLNRAFGYENSTRLTEVYRQSSNDLLRNLENIRNATHMSTKVTNSNDGSLSLLNKAEYNKEIVEAFKNDPVNSIYISYTKQATKDFNINMKRILTGNNSFQVGDKLMGYGGKNTKQITQGNVANSMSYIIESIDKEQGLAIFNIKAQSNILKTLKDRGLNVGEYGVSRYIMLDKTDSLVDESITQEELDATNKHIGEKINVYYEAYMKEFKAPYSKFKWLKIKEAKEAAIAFIGTYDFGADYFYNPTTKLMQRTPALGGELSSIFSTEKGLDYGYGINVHKAQGITVDRAFVDVADIVNKGRNTRILNNKGEFLNTEKNALYYVAMSRARKNVTVDNSSGVLTDVNQIGDIVSEMPMSIPETTDSSEDMQREIDRMLESGEITYTNEEGIPCAEMGLTNTVKGANWKIVKDFKGKPKHSNGGVDITISDKGVTMRRGGADIKAKYGLLIINNN